jgi:hypothetical protein
LAMRMLMIPFLVLLSAGVLSAGSRTPEERFPEIFASRSEAVSAGCSISTVRSPDAINCVLKKFEGQAMYLGIYDEDPKVGFHKTAELCVPSWYNMATVTFTDLLGDRRHFLDVTFEGDTGTGTLQMIRMLIGWNGARFVPVFAETVSYRMGSLGYEHELSVTPIFQAESLTQVSVLLKYRYVEGQESDAPPKSLWRSTFEWQTLLKWDTLAFAFREEPSDAQLEKRPRARAFWIEDNLRRIRASLSGVSVETLCADFFDKSEIMSVLDDSENRKAP